MRDGGRLAERFRGKLKYLGHNLLVGKASNSQVSCRYPFANRGGVALMYYGSFVVSTSLGSIQSKGPRDKAVIPTCFVDANHAGNLIRW